MIAVLFLLALTLAIYALTVALAVEDTAYDNTVREARR
ncbi:hypothetical protein GA0115252_14648 [Streptomyces sp. DfronAA-171]|nr:hypothetical protein GA0115252_14648 [Streptomyces sp. DfronAA-171]